MSNPQHKTDASPNEIIQAMGQKTREAAHILAQTDKDTINTALECLAGKIRGAEAALLEANQKDVEAGKAKDLSDAMLDRLTLTPERIETIAKGVEDIIALDDPVGEILESWEQPNGLKFEKISVPIGVLGMIYESRPNVTIDAAALCLKSHNAVILRGGSESFESSHALHNLIVEALKENNLPESCICMIPTTDREMVGAMLAAHEYIDVMIPRGGSGLTGRVMREATMPVFAHLDGNCHIYIHSSAKEDIARSVTLNAKTRRTGICGAAESLLLDQDLDPIIAKAVLNDLLEAGVIVVGDAQSQALDDRIVTAAEEDWGAEYLDMQISCKMVAGVQEAITHINHYGSNHTDSILAEDPQAVDDFLKNVDSAIVMHNTSTQFADGGEFGMGAEIGIGTGKLHARGPVGVRQLTTFKYVVRGEGQTRP